VSLDAVGRFVTMLNEEMSRQAVIEIRIAEVTIENQKQAGVDWSAVLDTVSSMPSSVASISGATSGIGTDVTVSKFQGGHFSFSLSGVTAAQF